LNEKRKQTGGRAGRLVHGWLRCCALHAGTLDDVTPASTDTHAAGAGAARTLRHRLSSIALHSTNRASPSGDRATRHFWSYSVRPPVCPHFHTTVSSLVAGGGAVLISDQTMTGV